MRPLTLAVLLLCPLARADEVDTLIIDLARDRDPVVRLKAVVALAELGESADRAVPHLVKAMQRDRDYRVQLGAARALGVLKLRPKEVIPAIDAEMRKQLRKTEGVERNYGIIEGGLEALRSFGNEAHESLPVALHCLKDQHKQIRLLAVRAVGATTKTDEEATQAVKALTTVAENDSEKEVRDAARSTAKTLAP